MDNRPHSSRWRIPVLGVFAGGLAYALLQTGAFGALHLAARVAIIGAVAGVTALLVSV